MVVFYAEEIARNISQRYLMSTFVRVVKQRSPTSTSEVAEGVGCSSDNAYRRLKRLKEYGQVRSKMAGNSLIWFPAE
jgi:predicted transcriptional regulator